MTDQGYDAVVIGGGPVGAAGLDPQNAFNTLTDAGVHAPSGTCRGIGRDRIHAYVLDRAWFDEPVMVQTLESGVGLDLVGALGDRRWPGNNRLQVLGWLIDPVRLHLTHVSIAARHLL